MIVAEHPSGLRIQFSDSAHSYQIVETGQNLLSVTTLIDSFFPEFEKEEVAAKCAVKYDRPKEEIIKEWEAKGKRAANEGTNVHQFAEHCLFPKNRKKVEPISERTSLIFKQVKNAIRDIKQTYKIIASEQIIFSPKYLVAGTIDVVMRDKKSGYVAFGDWKQNEKITRFNQWQNALPPIAHLEDCHINRYALQLGCYRKICAEEGYYEDVKYADMVLFHLGVEGYDFIELPNLKDEVDIIFETYKKILSKTI